MRPSPAKLGGAVLLAMTACHASPGSFPGEDSALEGRSVTIESRGELDPRFVPALEALEGALADGNDTVARKILDRLMLLGPTGPSLDLARSFERILAGREAVAGVDLRVETRLVRGEKGEPDRLEIAFTGRRQREGECTLEPGPATLRIEATGVDARGNTSRSSQIRAFDDLRAIVIRSGEPTVVPLVAVPVALPKGALALALRTDLRLCSGSVREGDVSLPAMRLRILPGEATILAAELGAAGASAPEDLARLALEPRTSVRAALEIAVRLPRDQREAALDRLAESSDTLVLPTLERFGPALGWLAPSVQLGNDALAWRHFLRERQRAAEAEARRGGLALPRRTPSALAQGDGH